MNRKVMAVAVAAALGAPAALAQTTVTIGGTINIMWDFVRASGASRTTPSATNGDFNVRSHDRVRDGAGSNIRFFVGEELGGGNQAFIQVESAVVNNSDTRTNNLGNALAPAAAATGAVSGVTGWGNRNTAIGIRSKPAGRFLIGVWDMHYDEMYGIESGWLTANSGGSALAVWQNFGSGFTLNPATGGRLSNTIRWDSPQWGGFSMSAQYARPTDGAPVPATLAAGTSVISNKKNKAYHFAARYQVGGLQVRYGYFRDDDAVSGVTTSFAGVMNAYATSSHEITSNRLGVRYRFPFGLGLGFVWDRSNWEINTDVAAGPGGSSDIKRTSWAIPVTYEFGNHGIYGTYGRARDWRGTYAGCSVSDSTTAGCFNTVIQAAGTLTTAANGHTLGGDTGSRFVSLGYTYKLSQRTNVHVTYQKVSNDALARYDFFANTSGTTGTAVGADPRSFALGLRHTF